MQPAAPRVRTLADIAELLEAHADLHALLLHVERLELPDSWIGAGFVRNAVWDALHGHPVETSKLNDVDVVYFDPAEADAERDQALEMKLKASAPNVPWQVRNQARMHRRNGDAPYRNTSDAIACWPETATAIAARTAGGKVFVTAPLGIEDLVGLVVRPTPVFARKMDVYRERLSSKNWASRWPNLTFSNAVSDTAS